MTTDASRISSPQIFFQNFLPLLQPHLRSSVEERRASQPELSADTCAHATHSAMLAAPAASFGAGGAGSSVAVQWMRSREERQVFHKFQGSPSNFISLTDKLPVYSFWGYKDLTRMYGQVIMHLLMPSCQCCFSTWRHSHLLSPFATGMNVRLCDYASIAAIVQLLPFD